MSSLGELSVLAARTPSLFSLSRSGIHWAVHTATTVKRTGDKTEKGDIHKPNVAKGQS